MLQPSRSYTRLLNSLVDERIANAPRRSPWFHMNPGERADYLAELDRRLLEIQRTTLSVLAAQYYSMADNPRAIDEHLHLLRQRREQLAAQPATPAQADYRQRLDDDIHLYSRQQAAMQGYEQAWRKALKLLLAGNGLDAPCAALLQRLQRLTGVARHKLDSIEDDHSRHWTTLFARLQGWTQMTQRYQTLLDAPAEKVAAALAGVTQIPAASDELPVNLSLLLMEERPGYVRLNVALVDPCHDGRYKDLYLSEGQLVVQPWSSMNFSFGTAARSLAWQQQYRLKHEPVQAHSPTFAPIRSVLVRSRFVLDVLGLSMVSEHTLRSGFLLKSVDDGMSLRVINVDRKVPNQVGLLMFNQPRESPQVRSVDLPQSLSELLNRYADITSFQTIALESYARSHYDPDRDGTFVSLRELEQSLGFAERLYLLELPEHGQFLAATPFSVLGLQGRRVSSRLLSTHLVRRTYLHNAVFFRQLEQLREKGEAACPWLDSSVQRSAFMAQWLRLLERNHLTPGGILPVPEKVRASLRDIKGNPLGKVLWEQAFATAVWHWAPVDDVLSRLAGYRARRELKTLLADPYLQGTLARAGHYLGGLLAPMSHQARALKLLRLLLVGAAALESDNPTLHERAALILSSKEGRDLRKLALCQVLLAEAGQDAQPHSDAHRHVALGDQPGHGRMECPDPYLILNSRPEVLLAAEGGWLIAEDKYRGYNQYFADPQSPVGLYMEELDCPFVGGLSSVTASVCRELPLLFDGEPSLADYWCLQLAFAAFLLRNGYHSFFETIYQAARFEPQVADGIGEQLLELFDRCRAPDTGAGALYQGCCALILPLVNDDLAQGLHLRPPRFGLFGPFEAGEHG